MQVYPQLILWVVQKISLHTERISLKSSVCSWIMQLFSGFFSNYRHNYKWNPPIFWKTILFDIPDLERHVRSETHLKPENVPGTMILGLLKLANLRNSWNFDIFTYSCACYVQSKDYNMISSKILCRNSIKFVIPKYWVIM